MPVHRLFFRGIRHPLDLYPKGHQDHPKMVAERKLGGSACRDHTADLHSGHPVRNLHLRHRRADAAQRNPDAGLPVQNAPCAVR